MEKTIPLVHPYIPNSAPQAKTEMLKAAGATSVEEFYAAIPENLRLRRPLDLPEPLLSEVELRRHIDGLLEKNKSTQEYLSFLGAGCWQHQVPSVCDEINSRGEFLTAYAGDPYEDHGVPGAVRVREHDGRAAQHGRGQRAQLRRLPAAATSLRMAARITGRSRVLLSGTTSDDILSKIEDYLTPDIQVELLPYQPDNGLMDLEALKNKISEQQSAVFFENPSYLGIIETQADQIATIAHQQGALCVVSVDPISLGVINPPPSTALTSFVVTSSRWHAHALRRRSRRLHRQPGRPQDRYGISLALVRHRPTVVEGEYGFGDVAYERTSFALREEGKEWVGTAAALWGITPASIWRSWVRKEWSRSERASCNAPATP